MSWYRSSGGGAGPILANLSATTLRVSSSLGSATAVVEYRLLGATPWTSAGSQALPYTITGLTANQSYEVRLTEPGRPSSITVTAPTAAPAFTAQPTISPATPAPGAVITISTGTVTGSPPPTLTAQLFVGGVNVSAGLTGTGPWTYTLPGGTADQAAISAIITAANGLPPDATGTATATVNAAPVNTVPPSATVYRGADVPVTSGMALYVGETLTRVPGSWTGGTSTTFTWRRSGAIVGSADTYVIQAADRGFPIQPRETRNSTVSNGPNSGLVTYAPPTGASIPDQIYPINSAITPLDAATYISGLGLGYALAPASAALPAGLSLNGTTGVISGTPTAAGSATIVIRATNDGGFLDRAFQITVQSVAAPSFTVPPAISAPRLPGGTITLTDGTVIDGSVTARALTLIGTPVSVTGTGPRTYTIPGGTAPGAALVWTVTATGPGGSTPASASASVQSAATVPTSSLSYGMNYNTDSQPAAPFLNLAKQARPFQGGGLNFDELRVAGHVNQLGYPVSLPPLVTELRSYLLVLGQTGTDSQNYLDTYVLKWTGAPNGLTLSITGGGAAVTSSAANRIEFTVTGNPAISWLWTSGVISDVVCCRISDEAAIAAGEVWNPDYLANLANVHTIRFMDWMGTNGSKITSWAERPTLSAYTYMCYEGVVSHFPYMGMPVELMVDICNRTGSNGWWCQPHLTGDEYVTQLATYIRDNLAPGLVAYYEFTNEGWNFGFPQWSYLDQQGDLLWGASDNSNPNMSGRKFVHMARALAAVYGPGQRAVKYHAVACFKGGSASGADQYLDAPLWRDATDPVVSGDYEPPYTWADAYAVAGYFGAIVYKNATEISELYTTWQTDQTAALLAYDDCLRSPLGSTGMRNSLLNVRASAQVAAAYGLPYLYYEGGTHIVHAAPASIPPMNQDQTTTAIAPMGIAFAESEYTAELYRRSITLAQQITDGPYMQFTNVGPASGYGTWGLRKSLYDNSTPKVAVVTALETTPQWWVSSALPLNIFPPAIEGAPVQGAVLTAYPGIWRVTPGSYAYRWLRAGSPIAGATAATYTLTATDNGQPITVEVTVTNVNGPTAAVSPPLTPAATFAASLLPVWLDGGTATRFSSRTGGVAATNGELVRRWTNSGTGPVAKASIAAYAPQLATAPGGEHINYLDAADHMTVELPLGRYTVYWAGRYGTHTGRVIHERLGFPLPKTRTYALAMSRGDLPSAQRTALLATLAAANTTLSGALPTGFSFVITVSAGQTMVLPANAAGTNVTINWGGTGTGATTQVGATPATWTYDVAGTYTVTVTGTLPTFNIYTTTGGNAATATQLAQRAALVAILGFGGGATTTSMGMTAFSMQSASALEYCPLMSVGGTWQNRFAACTALRTTPPGAPAASGNSMFSGSGIEMIADDMNLGGVTTFANAFFNCTSLQTFPADALLNKNLTTFGTTFTGCALRQPVVDDILEVIAQNIATVSGIGTGTISLAGGSSDVPSKRGQIAANAIRAAGWTVAHNGVLGPAP